MLSSSSSSAMSGKTEEKEEGDEGVQVKPEKQLYLIKSVDFMEPSGSLQFNVFSLLSGSMDGKEQGMLKMF